MPAMIVDVHTHIFPPRFIAERRRLVDLDATFAAMYREPRARMATVEDLLASMDEAGVDVSIASGFWWHDAALAAEHAQYLVEAARASAGRILPFVPVTSSVPAGARGLGEARLHAPGDEARIAEAAAASSLPVLIHCTEEAGHEYPGKHGGLTSGGLWRFLHEHGDVRVIAAHWGGGFPFYALMPEVRALLASGRVIFDTSASHLLYEPRIFRAVSDLAGSEFVAWGSDFPLRRQAADRTAVEAALADARARAQVLGDNAARFLGLQEQ
jgi:predicted TIM-barrel fold metal-dependent hydrolase